MCTPICVKNYTSSTPSVKLAVQVRTFNKVCQKGDLN